MPNSNKETVSVSEEINILKRETENHTQLTNYYPDTIDDDQSFRTHDTTDGFTDFLNIIDARKVRVSNLIFPEDSN